MNKEKLLNDSILKLSLKINGKDSFYFFTRLGKAYHKLEELFFSIYEKNRVNEAYFQKLLEALGEKYVERVDDLKKIDIEREENKEWFMNPNWVGTMLYTDRYNKDLKGFIKKIDYLEELGINYVHLMPLLSMPKGENDGGYAVSDYKTVDKKFGTMKDIENISKIFREKNMLLELDLVLNHTSNEHEWAKKALNGEKEFQDMYYMYDNRKIPDEFEKSLPEVFPETAPGNFTYLSEINKWVFTVFNTYQWDLNYTNPKVFIEMAKILLNLANKGIDIMRLDAVAFMWKRIGTSSQNLPEAHTVLQLFKACTKIVAPGVLFKAEAIVQPEDIVKYLGLGGEEECEIAYNASYMVYLWDAMATQNKKILENGLSHIPRLPKGTTWINYIRCHDDIGLGYADKDIMASGYSPYDHKQFIISYYVGEFQGSPAKGQRFMYNPKTGDSRITGSTASLLGLEKAIDNKNHSLEEKALKKILLMHSGIMTLGGIPLVYYGDELASVNDYSYLKEPSKKNDNRWLNRPVIDWEKSENRSKKGTVEYKIFNGIKKMIQIRKNIKEFHSENDFELVKNENDHIFSFLREFEGEKTLVLMNMSEHAQYLNQYILEKTGIKFDAVDQFSGKKVEVHNREIKLLPFEFLWLK